MIRTRPAAGRRRLCACGAKRTSLGYDAPRTSRACNGELSGGLKEGGLSGDAAGVETWPTRRPRRPPTLKCGDLSFNLSPPLPHGRLRVQPCEVVAVGPYSLAIGRDVGVSKRDGGAHQFVQQRSWSIRHHMGATLGASRNGAGVVIVIWKYLTTEMRFPSAHDDWLPASMSPRMPLPEVVYT